MSEMVGRSLQVSALLADALIYEAQHSSCVDDLVRGRMSEEVRAWCFDCPDAQGCWAWRSMAVLSRREILEAERRLRQVGLESAQVTRIPSCEKVLRASAWSNLLGQ